MLSDSFENLYNKSMLIDSFIFAHELILLDMRLHYLNEKVDKFVLVESTTTHSGLAKKLTFDENKSQFKKYAHKIEHVIIDDLSGPLHQLGQSWTRENKHRNGILEGIKNNHDTDLIMISDVDEIPRVTEVGKIGGYKQEFLYYYLDVYTPQPWVGTFCTTVGDVKKHTPQKFRDIRFQNCTVLHGGWHISFFMTPEEIQNKIKTFAHQEYNDIRYTDVEKIKERLENLQDPFDRSKLIPGGIDLTMPQYIFDHPEIFKDKFRFLHPF